MTLTARYIEQNGSLRPFMDEEHIMESPIKLICLVFGFYPNNRPAFEPGEIVHANKFQYDTSKRYPNTVHLKEKGYWWPLDSFSPDTTP